MTNIVNLNVNRIATKPARISCNIWGHHVTSADGHTITFRCYPLVMIAKATKPKSNDEVLVGIIRRAFGGETFTSRQLAKHAETNDALLSALGGRLGILRIGMTLRGIKCIEAVDYERHVASWKVSPSQ